MKEALRKKLIRPETAVFLFILLNRCFYYLNTQAGKWIQDTGSYVDYDPKLCYRMFGYPLLIDLFQWLMKDGFGYGVTAVQIVLSLISIWYLYRALMIVTGEKRGISLIMTAFYGCSPAIMQWDMILVTESLSLSFTVFFVYHALAWLKEFRKRDAVGMVLSVFWGTITKTALFVFVGAILLLLILLFFLKSEDEFALAVSARSAGKAAGKSDAGAVPSARTLKRRILGFALILTLLLGLFDLGYCSYNYKHCGLFSMSNLSARHKIVHALRSGTYLEHPDREMVEKIEEIYRANGYEYAYATTTPVLELFGDTQVEQNRKALAFAKECLRSDLPAYAKDLVRTAVDEMFWKYDAPYETRLCEGKIPNLLLNLQQICFSFLRVAYVCALCFAALVWLVAKWIREKKCPFALLGLSGGMLLILVTVNLAAYSEWTRLLDYILPFVYVTAGMMLAAIPPKSLKKPYN
ncbi:MAG: glycosyltransferase family 39 protein [Lachnospiraceae bacterium]|nr:glycosyltransferase family 39 protein [Lachnospiraceae bacterium]